jgi:hypothetical protein
MQRQFVYPRVTEVHRGSRRAEGTSARRRSQRGLVEQSLIRVPPRPDPKR